MLLYLLRHANADTPAAQDDERPLTGKGQAQARKVARFCSDHECLPELILTSPLLRARETAAPLGERLGREVFVTPWLKSGMEPEEALAGLQEHREFEAVLLVGHEPDLSRLIGHLLGCAGGQVLVRKASLTLLDVPVLRAGTATLLLALPCRLM